MKTSCCTPVAGNVECSTSSYGLLRQFWIGILQRFGFDHSAVHVAQRGMHDHGLNHLRCVVIELSGAHREASRIAQHEGGPGADHFGGGSKMRGSRLSASFRLSM